MGVEAVAGLEGPLGAIAGGTLLTLLGILFTVLLSTLLKVGSRADTINEQLVTEKNARIKELEDERDMLRADRDHWFAAYDRERSGRQVADAREDTPHEPPP